MSLATDSGPCVVCGESRRTRLRDLGGSSLLECPSCKLVHVWPFPTPGDLEKLYTEAYYSRDAAMGGYVDYGAASELKVHSFARVLDKLSNGTPGRLLDVGAAEGVLLGLASERGWSVVGIEPSEKACAVARAKGHTVVCGFLPEALEEIEGTFDVITMLDVVEHLPDPSLILRSLRGYLRPGGRLAVLTPDWGGIFRPFMGKHWPHLKPHEHLWYFRKKNLEELCARAGYARPVARAFFKTVTMDYLLADFAKHDGIFGGVSRVLKGRLPLAKMPAPLYLDEMLAIVTTP